MSARKKEGHLVVTLVRRPGTEKLRKVTWSMGLRKLHRTKRYPDRPEIRGMIFAVKHLLEVVEEK
jgi:large subunit ribosomal protein L30